MSVTSLIVQNVPVLLLITLTYHLYTTYYAAGLDRYPGPLLAKFGKLWHWVNVKSSRHQLDLVDLHRQHGDVVRIGPTTLSICNPDYVAKVYGVSVGYKKSDMYDIFAPRVNGKILVSLLSARDPQAHAELHKPMAKEFAVGVVSQYEPLVDQTILKWVSCLDERFCQTSGQVCDLALWVRLYAQEAIMDITFSESLGFLDQGADVGGFLAALDRNIDASGLQTTMPWTAYVLKHNPIVAMFQKDSTMFPDWALGRIQARIAARQEVHKSNTTADAKPVKDFLDRFLDASPTDEPPYFNFPLVMNWCLVNIMAGGDTTAIALAAIVYHLLKNPDKQIRLVTELRSSSAPSSPPPSWRHCQTLPYLDSCIREGFRLHPSIGLGLERDAPGLVMPDGYTLPAEVKVSMNAWVVNRQERIFGPRVDEFVPERWLRAANESESHHVERVARMKRVDLNFGSGARACTGKAVAVMETYKAIATLFRDFNVGLVDPDEEWVAVNRWATRVRDVKCTLVKV